jgi:hypothetical protein
MRLAFSCFFALLFQGRLPPEAVPFLTEMAPPPEPGAPEPDDPRTTPFLKPVVETRAAPQHEAPDGALALLALLQREGRLVDFLRESLDSHDDAAVGAAARDVHRGCRKVLEDHLKLEPVMPGQEETMVTIPRGFDPGEIRIIGETRGAPPWKGTLVHHGWRAVEVKFPQLGQVDRRVLAPAEVRLV